MHFLYQNSGFYSGFERVLFWYFGGYSAILIALIDPDMHRGVDQVIFSFLMIHLDVARDLTNIMVILSHVDRKL